MKTVAIYMRVSTSNQEDEQTINNQKMELLEHLRNEGLIYSPDLEYQDNGWSGATLERPALDQLRADALEKKFDTLYFYDRGRLSRKFVHQEIVLEGLRDAGVECISLHDVNGVSSDERLMGGVMGIFAEYERLKIAERMRIGKLRKVRENKKLLGYQPKYGYDYLPRIKKGNHARDGKFVINEKQAEVVRLMFEWAASGLSKYAIQKELFDRSILPYKAKRNVWSTSVIDRLLRDSTYMGEHYYNKSESIVTKNPRKEVRYRKAIKGSRRVRPQEEWLPVKVSPIITSELFQEVQTQLKRNKRTYDRKNGTHQYLVGGIIECPCGFARTGDPSNNSLYYRCNDRQNNRLGTRKCYEHGVNAPVLDDLVWSNIEKLLTQPKLVYEQASKWEHITSPLQLRLNQLQSHLDEQDEKERRIAKVYAEGIMSEYIYKETLSEINEKRISISRDMSAINDELKNTPSIPLEKLIEGVVKLVEDLDFSKKREIIQKVVTKVVATKQEVIVWGHIPILATEDYDKYNDINDTQNNTQPYTISNQSEVGLNVKHWHRRPSQRRQVHPIQRPHRQRHFGG